MHAGQDPGQGDPFRLILWHGGSLRTRDELESLVSLEHDHAGVLDMSGLRYSDVAHTMTVI